ncbi:hypothetical protein GCM10009809_21240 [Isoptericola hypogeus]|uniref:DUF559 domain-containing protein n=1 Tax=Isoptericola hypogeus TaxID=300179 RepID=A0ABN2JG64_9MICO
MVSIGQCREHGMTDQQVGTLVGTKRWRRVMLGVLDPGVPATGLHDAFDRARRRGAIVGSLAFPGSVVTGVPALVLHGVQGAPRRVLPEVTFPNGAPRTSEKPVRVRRERLRRWMLVDRIPCVPVELALAQAVPELDRGHAVALMDSARQRRLITEDGFRLARDLARGRRGAARTAPWWDASDPRAESPVESDARLAFVDAGYPPDAVQLEILDEHGRFLARPDLAWFLPDGRVVPVELDGHEAHSTPEALFGDRRRQNALVARGARMLRFTGRDVAADAVVPEVSRLLDAEGWAPRPWPSGEPLILPTPRST